MSAQDEGVDALRQALDNTEALIAGITPEQRSQPTPCRDWDVETLVTHVVGGLDNFTKAARGEQADWQAPRPSLGDDWPADFHARAATLLDAWQSADPERRPQIDMQVAEQCVHAWDIARATDQPYRLDPAVAERALVWAHAMLKPEWRGAGGGGAFGEEVAVAEDAPMEDRLAGWFGRDPYAWPASSRG